MVGSVKDIANLATYRKISLLVCFIIFLAITSLLILNIVLYRITILWGMGVWKWVLYDIWWRKMILCTKIAVYFMDNQDCAWFPLTIYTTISAITANNTKIIRNLVILLSIALRIITFNPFFTFLTRFLNSLFSSSSWSKA